MDKTSNTEFYRLFLLEALPEPLTRSSAHIQLFDNYVTGTRIRMRSVRSPETREWVHILQQRFPADDTPGVWKIAEMYLNEAEYEQFKVFEGNEIRKNRYFHEFDGRMVAFDVYLGELWGLNTARVDFADRAEMENYTPPKFAAFEVTGNLFFAGDSLVYKRFEEIQAEVAKLAERAEQK